MGLKNDYTTLRDIKHLLRGNYEVWPIMTTWGAWQSFMTRDFALSAHSFISQALDFMVVIFKMSKMSIMSYYCFVYKMYFCETWWLKFKGIHYFFLLWRLFQHIPFLHWSHPRYVQFHHAPHDGKRDIEASQFTPRPSFTNEERRFAELYRNMDVSTFIIRAKNLNL